MKLKYLFGFLLYNTSTFASSTWDFWWDEPHTSPHYLRFSYTGTPSFVNGHLYNVLRDKGFFNDIAGRNLSDSEKYIMTRRALEDGLTPDQINETSVNGKEVVAHRDFYFDRLPYPELIIREKIFNSLPDSILSGWGGADGKISIEQAKGIARLVTKAGITVAQITFAKDYLGDLSGLATLDTRANQIISMTRFINALNAKGFLATNSYITTGDLGAIINSFSPFSLTAAEIMGIYVGDLSSHTIEQRIMYIRLGLSLASKQTLYQQYDNDTDVYPSTDNDRGYILNKLVYWGRVTPESIGQNSLPSDIVTQLKAHDNSSERALWLDLYFMSSDADRTSVKTWLNTSSNESIFIAANNTGVTSGLLTWGNGTDDGNLKFILNQYALISSWGNLKTFLKSLTLATDKRKALLWAQTSAYRELADKILSYGLHKDVSSWGDGNSVGLLRILNQYAQITTWSGITFLNTLTTADDKRSFLNWLILLSDPPSATPSLPIPTVITATQSSNPSSFTQAQQLGLLSGLTSWGSGTDGAIFDIVSHFSSLYQGKDSWGNLGRILNSFTDLADKRALIGWAGTTVPDRGLFYDTAKSSGLLDGLSTWTQIGSIMITYNELRGDKNWENTDTFLDLFANGAEKRSMLAWGQIEINRKTFDSAISNGLIDGMKIWGNGSDNNILSILNLINPIVTAKDDEHLLTGFTDLKDKMNAITWYNTYGAIFNTLNQSTTFKAFDKVNDLSTIVNAKNGYQQLTEIFSKNGFTSSDMENLSKTIDITISESSQARGNRIGFTVLTSNNPSLFTNITDSKNAQKDLVSGLLAANIDSASAKSALFLIDTSSSTISVRVSRIAMAAAVINLEGTSLATNLSGSSISFIASLISKPLTSTDVAKVAPLIDMPRPTDITSRITQIGNAITKYNAAGTDAANIISLAITPVNKMALLDGYAADINKSSFAKAFASGVLLGNSAWGSISAILVNYQNSGSDADNVISLVSAKKSDILRSFASDANKLNFANAFKEGLFNEMTAQTTWSPFSTILANFTAAKDDIVPLFNGMSSITDKRNALIWYTTASNAKGKILHAILSLFTNVSDIKTLVSGKNGQMLITEALGTANTTSVIPLVDTSITESTERRILRTTTAISLNGALTSNTIGKDVVNEIVTSQISPSTITPAMNIIGFPPAESATSRINRIKIGIFISGNTFIYSRVSGSTPSQSLMNAIVSLALDPNDILAAKDSIDTSITEDAIARANRINMAISVIKGGLTSTKSLVNSLISSSMTPSQISSITAMADNLTAKNALINSYKSDTANQPIFLSALNAQILSDFTSEVSWNANIQVALNNYRTAGSNALTITKFASTGFDKRSLLASYKTDTANQSNFAQAASYLTDLTSETSWASKIKPFLNAYTSVKASNWSNMGIFLNLFQTLPDKRSALIWASTSTNRSIFDAALSTRILEGLSTWGFGSGDAAILDILTQFGALKNTTPWTSLNIFLGCMSDSTDKRLGLVWAQNSQKRTLFDASTSFMSTGLFWGNGADGNLLNILNNYETLRSSWGTISAVIGKITQASSGSSLQADKRSSILYFGDNVAGGVRRNSYSAALSYFSDSAKWSDIQACIDAYISISTPTFWVSSLNAFLTKIISPIPTTPTKREILLYFGDSALGGSRRAGQGVASAQGFLSSLTAWTAFQSTINKFAPLGSNAGVLFSGFSGTLKVGILDWYTTKGGFPESISIPSIYAGVYDIATVSANQNGYQRLISALDTANILSNGEIIKPTAEQIKNISNFISPVSENAITRAKRIAIAINLNLNPILVDGMTGGGIKELTDSLMIKGVLPTKFTANTISGEFRPGTVTQRADAIKAK